MSMSYKIGGLAGSTKHLTGQAHQGNASYVTNNVRVCARVQAPSLSAMPLAEKEEKEKEYTFWR